MSDRTVVVDRIEWDGQSTVAFGWGRDQETDEPIRWAGDHRPMSLIAEAVARLDDDEPVFAIVPDWAVL